MTHYIDPDIAANALRKNVPIFMKFSLKIVPFEMNILLQCV